MQLIAITGTTRGFGQALVSEIIRSHLISIPTVILLINRTSCLNDDHYITEYQKTGNNCDLKVINITAELGIEKKFDFLEEFAGKVQHAFLFNNAGMLGKLDYVNKLAPVDVSQAITTNLIGTIDLTCSFLKSFPQSTIINISSLAALQPFETWSLYSTCKSGLDMFHKSLALENPQCRVLNYAPGPLDTRMQDQIRIDMPECPLREQFREMKAKNMLIKPQESAQKLISLVEKDEFESGVHLDYYDI